MKRMLRLTVPLLLVSLIVLTGCTTTTANIPLLLRYVDGTQQELTKMIWDPMTGVVVPNINPISTFTDTATFSLRELWVGVRPNYWVPLIQPAVSNTAVYWNGSDRLTLFTTDELSTQEDTNIVKITNPQYCRQYTNATNCVVTDTAMYILDRSYDTSTLYKYTASGIKPIKVPGSLIGAGEYNNKLYALTSIKENTKEHLMLHVIDPDGTMVSKVVANSEITLYENSLIETYDEVYSTFANGSFYMWGSKVDVTSGTPQFISVPSLIDGFNAINSSIENLINESDPVNSSPGIRVYDFTLPEPAFYSYKDYVLVVGSTFDLDEVTVAAFKNDKLVGFMLITPLIEKHTEITTYDATGRQLKSYIIRTPAQVIVPQS